jgi:hypothetical protein
VAAVVPHGDAGSLDVQLSGRRLADAVLGGGRDVPMPETLLDKGDVPLPSTRQIGRVRVTLLMRPDVDPGSVLQSAKGVVDRWVGQRTTDLRSSNR